MSGETPTNNNGRFSSQNGHYANNNKKYPGSPKSPMLNTIINTNAGGNRNSQTRQRLLVSKISAPRPINLPSLRREHAAGSEVSSSPSSQHGWGSAGRSPQTEIKSNSLSPEDQAMKESPLDSNESPTLASSQSNARAWEKPSTTKTPTPSNDFPTAAEASKKASLNDDKDYLKYASSDPNHTSWDEMVNEDLDDFSVDVIEFDDGTRVQVGADTDPNSPVVDTVLPSERFNDDYDRSYTGQSQRNTYNRYEHNDHHMNNGYRPYRRSVDHGYNSRYNGNNTNFENRRYNGAEGERRPSSERWPRRESTENYTRRSSYDRKAESYHPPAGGSLHSTTSNQRTRRHSEHSFKSDHSREDAHEHNPLQIIEEPASGESETITVAQKNVMLTAAERAKKRRDEQEAEYKAAAERARQKAAALAEKAEEAKKSATTPTPTVVTASSPKQETSPLPNTSKPWNIVAAKQEASKSSQNSPVKSSVASSDPQPEAPKGEEEETTEAVSKPGEKKLTQDDKDWATFVSKRRNNEEITTEASSSDWRSFANRLQEREGDKYNYTYTQINSPEVVEVHDFSHNEEWGTLPPNLANSRSRKGWIKTDEHGSGRGRGRERERERSNSERGRGRGRGATMKEQWRTPDVPTKKVEEPGMIEILKHEPMKEEAKEDETLLPHKERLSLLFNRFTSPLLPNFLAKLEIKKPSNLSFMVEDVKPQKDTVATEPVEEQSMAEETSELKVEEKHHSEEKTPEMESDIVESSSVNKSASTISSVESSSFEESSPSKATTNSHFPVLVYEYPQDSTDEDSKDSHYQRPTGVFFMPPPHQYSTSQFMVPYPQAGTGHAQPIYFPPVPWLHPEQPSQFTETVRPSHELHRYNNSGYKYNNGNRNEWNRPSGDYQRYNSASYPRGTFRNKRGSWANQPSASRGRGGFPMNGKRYHEEHH